MKKHLSIPTIQHETLKDLINFGAEQFGDQPAFIYPERKTDISVSFRRLKQEIDALGTWMYTRGYRNCQIAVFGENSYPWLLTYFAVVCGGNVIVPLDKELPPEEAAQLLTESECRAVFYSKQYADVGRALQEMNLENLDVYPMASLPEMVAAGAEAMENGNREYLDKVIRKEDLASIVFTSGTSGKSKGVMLTHLNFCSNTFGSCDAVDIYSSTALLVLPLHHTFGLVTNVFSAICYGYPVYINKSLKRVLTDIQKVKPYILCVVPLFVETIHRSIWESARKQGKEKLLRNMMKVSDALLACGIDLRRKFFKSVLEPFGGNLELIISGGAPLDEQLIRCFRSFGITVQNGYGITECSPVVSVTRGSKPVFGSVGQPLLCNEVKISDEGEILVRGDNVMMGYYNNPQANEDCFRDGWFRTGDLGRIDSKGNLYVTGRIKNLIILSNGENISAEAIEEKVCRAIPYVKEAVAYGLDGVIAVEMFLDPEVPDGAQRIDGDIKALNRTLPQVKTIGKVVLRDTEFPKTSTKKIKRHNGGK